MALFRPAMQSTLPRLARDPAQLPPANALLDTTERIARLLGPGLVGADRAGCFRWCTSLRSTPAVSSRPPRRLTVIAPAAARRRRLPPPDARRALAAVRRGFAAIRAPRCCHFTLSPPGSSIGAWSAAYSSACRLMIAHAGIAGPAAAGSRPTGW